MADKSILYKVIMALLLGFAPVAGIDVFAQVLMPDSLTMLHPDSVQHIKERVVEHLQQAEEELLQQADSLFTLTADSIHQANRENARRLQRTDSLSLAAASLLMPADSLMAAAAAPRKVWVPDSGRATWLAIVFPGGGQIYNRKYWKLPIVYGGFVGCAYALTWNNKMYTDYAQAYLDIMDKDPSTNSYYDIFGKGIGTIDESKDTTYGPRLKRNKDYFRRFRDISIFAFIGVYLISIIDAYVDAELSNFDIGPDLSMRLEPTVINDRKFSGGNSIGLQWSIRF